MGTYYSAWATPPNGGARYRLRLVTSVASQNPATNKTALDYDIFLDKDRSFAGFYAYSSTSWSVTINGTTVTSGSGANPDVAWTGWSSFLLASGQTTITHGTDGTKTVTLAASYVGANSGWAIGTVSISTSEALPTIERATLPIITPSPAVVGSTVAISLPRAVGTYTHDVTWVCGTMSGTIGTGLGASTTWTVPSVLGEYPLFSLVPIVITTVTKSGSTVIGTRQVTLFAKAAPATPTVDSMTPESQFDVRASLVEYVGGEWVRTSRLPATNIQLVDAASATATCSITLSALAMDIPDYSVVDIEIFNGTDWVFTDHRFVLSRVSTDEADPSEVRTYDGKEFIDFELGFAYSQKDYKWSGTKYIAATKKNPVPTHPRTTPGDIMRALVTAAQARGWGPRINFDFTALKTSLDEAWSNTGVERDINKGTPISQVLSGLVDDGLVEYRTSYHDNQAYIVLLNPGTGSDFTADASDPIVNLNLLNLTSAPRRSTVEQRITRVTVVGDAGAHATRENDPFDADVFGALEGWITVSGIKRNVTAAAIGDKALVDNGSATSERTFEYASASAGPQYYPYSVFRTGDWVLRPDRQTDSTVKDRISQITVDKKEGSTSITVLTGDRILSGTAVLAKRQSAQTGGAIAAGTQMSTETLDSRIPQAPSILTDTSLGYWNSDGAAQSAVTLTWSEVVLAVSESDIVVDIYEIWSRPSGIGAEWTFLSSTDQLVIEVGGWDVLADLEFRIRAKSIDGIYGDFSDDVVLTTAAPTVDLDGPVMTDLYTDGVGGIYAVWAGILGTTTAPARLAYVVAEVSTDAGATYTTEGTPITGPGTIMLNKGGIWGDYLVRLRGYDRLGNAGTASSSSAITITDPHIAPPTPAIPTSLAATAGAGWDASGFLPTAWFDLAWTAPTLDTDGNAVIIVGYDLWGKRSDETELRYLTSSNTESLRFAVGNGEEWLFQVSASSSFGGISALSDAVTATANATISAAAAPTAPTLSQYAGLLRIQWAGGGMVPQIKYVYATISTTSGGTYTRVGMPLNGAGEVVVPGLAPGDYYAKIVMVDELGTISTSAASAGITLLPITGITVQTSEVANTGIKMTTAALTAYDVSGNPTFILDAATGEVWIAPYDAVFDLGASGIIATTGAATTGISISSNSSSFNTFIHPSGVEIRNDQTPLSWWEADSADASLVNFFSPRAVIGQRLRVGDYEMLKEAKTTGTRLVIRYKGA